MQLFIYLFFFVYQDTAPQTSAALEKAYQESETFKRVQEEIVEYEEEIRNEVLI